MNRLWVNRFNELGVFDQRGPFRVAIAHLLTTLAINEPYYVIEQSPDDAPCCWAYVLTARGCGWLYHRSDINTAIET